MKLRWDKGGEGELLSFEVERARVRSTIPAAPGTPLRGELEGGLVLELKVRGSKREGDLFVVEGRPQNLRREVRDALLAWARGAQ